MPRSGGTRVCPRGGGGGRSGVPPHPEKAPNGKHSTLNIQLSTSKGQQFRRGEGRLRSTRVRRSGEHPLIRPAGTWTRTLPFARPRRTFGAAKLLSPFPKRLKSPPSGRRVEGRKWKTGNP